VYGVFVRGGNVGWLDCWMVELLDENLKMREFENLKMGWCTVLLYVGKLLDG
jgi:hypothetical protein